MYIFRCIVNLGFIKQDFGVLIIHEANGGTVSISLDSDQLNKLKSYMLKSPLSYNNKHPKPNVKSYFDEENIPIVGNLAVIMPNGDIISERKDWATLANFINSIGVNKVKDLGFKFSKIPLISSKLDKKYASSQRSMGDGLFLFTNLSNSKKKRLIEDIAKLLKIKVKVIIKENVGIGNHIKLKSEVNESVAIDSNSNHGPLIKDTSVRPFVYDVMRHISNDGLLDRISKYLKYKRALLSIAYNGQTILPSIFLATSQEELVRRNSASPSKRWFETPFSINGQVVYLSTQWTYDYMRRLNLKSFVEFINKIYGDKYLCKIEGENYFFTKSNTDSYKFQPETTYINKPAHINPKTEESAEETILIKMPNNRVIKE